MNTSESVSAPFNLEPVRQTIEVGICDIYNELSLISKKLYATHVARLLDTFRNSYTFPDDRCASLSALGQIVDAYLTERHQKSTFLYDKNTTQYRIVEFGSPTSAYGRHLVYQQPQPRAIRYTTTTIGLLFDHADIADNLLRQIYHQSPEIVDMVMLRVNQQSKEEV